MDHVLTIAAVSALVVCGMVLAIGFAAWLMRDRLQRWLYVSQQKFAWSQMPERIILMRHGEAEHNLDQGSILTFDNPNRKPDNLSELTETGRRQAMSSGQQIRQIVGEGGTISVIVSPFERTQQTLYCVQSELAGVKVRSVRVERACVSLEPHAIAPPI